MRLTDCHPSRPRTPVLWDRAPPGAPYGTPGKKERAWRRTVPKTYAAFGISGIVAPKLGRAAMRSNQALTALFLARSGPPSGCTFT